MFTLQTVGTCVYLHLFPWLRVDVINRWTCGEFTFAAGHLIIKEGHSLLLFQVQHHWFPYKVVRRSSNFIYKTHPNYISTINPYKSY